ncbi:hypothetical protein, partial [Paenibacillus zanthoxyli]|uniref:hypothetical protein n=1 Tax=Paenibacillus zanthoxyli TaxID=369399 RepID=UPI001E367BDF
PPFMRKLSGGEFTNSLYTPSYVCLPVIVYLVWQHSSYIIGFTLLGKGPYGMKLNLEPYTQWEPGVRFASSACGPSTMAAITEYWGRKLGETDLIGKERFGSKAEHINYLYGRYGGRPWGMSARNFAKGIKAYLRASLGDAPAIRLRASMILPCTRRKSTRAGRWR